MGVLNLVIVSISLLCGSTSIRIAHPRFPFIDVLDGHLRFVASEDKNISFETTSSAGVLINNMDLLTTLNRAHNATKLIERYQKFFAIYDDRIYALEQRVSEPAIVPNNTNASLITGLTNRRINRRLTMVLRKFNELRTSLLEDDCVSNPCRNGGICQDMFENYICHCQDGWEGPDCVQDVNECSKFVGTDLGCQNGATCINKKGSYECLCPAGFVGIHCTKRKADCSLGGAELCGYGTCVHQNNHLGYKCICDQGWKTDGTNMACTVDVNECDLNHPACSASPRVPCINVPGSYYCGACPQGYTGNGYYCADIDECAINNGGCSVSPMVQCSNTPGSRICGLCPPGYFGDGAVCSFRGVCNVDNGGCHHSAQCRDNPRISSTYVECICPAGYVGHGIGPNGCILSSKPFNPCASNPCVNGVCSTNNVTGDYICNCRRKYTGRNCDIIKDACTSNPCQNGGTCQNVFGLSFTCICKSEYIGPTCESQAQACGGQLRGLSGTLKYPSGDYATYGHRLSCAWTIETNSTKILNITFKKFDIEKSTGCRFDWLQIHDGRHSASRSLGRFCGDELPLGGKILSTHNIMYFWFRSDGRTAKSGFELTWNSTNPECGEYVKVTSHGSLESPGSPGNYPLNRDCYWILVAPPGKRFLFHFYSLMIGENANCDKDYLEFSTLLSTSHNTMFAKFCNSSEPFPFYSPGERAVIQFHSDDKDSYPGFQLTYSVVEAIPGCGGSYTSTEGIIQSIQPPDLNVHYLCDYKIQQPLNWRIKITFLSLDLRDTAGCTKDYVEVREGPNMTSPLVGRYCGTNLPGPYESLSNQLTIVSSTSKDTTGWKIQYSRVCLFTFTNVTGRFQAASDSLHSLNDCVYLIERPPGYIIELELKLSSMWVVENRPSHLNNFVEVRDGDHKNSTLIGKYFTPTTEKIITSTLNKLWIRSFHQQFDATYTSTDIGCGGILKSNIGNVASPTGPEGYYPAKLKCTWVIIAPPGNIVQLTWLTFNLEQSYECSYDNVRVYDNNTELGMGGLMGTYCGSTRPPILLSSSNIMTIVFRTDITIHMDGFLASYIFVPETKVCGANYFTPAGVIKSPGYPKDYPTDRECTWTITVPRGQQIMLNVSDFNIESYSGCRYDWLEIRNGGTSASPLIGRYCGTTIPKQIPSHTNKLYVFFKSDISRSGHGFKINWVSTATGCGGTLTSPSGSLISPHYPEPYGRNTECLWKIIVSAGSRIQLVFSDINLETHNQCSADYVQLFDGLTTNSKSLGRFCSEGATPIVTTGNQMLVKFRSDAAFQGRGFQLHYSILCRNTLHGYRGIIESPNFPNNYPQDQDCTWDIEVSSRNKINITFSHFGLERPSIIPAPTNCTFAYVEIKYAVIDTDNMDEDNNPNFLKQGTYCGSDNPGQISLDSDHAQVHFVSDKLLQGVGFRIEWQLFGCGGILTHKTGTIESPNYPKAYPNQIKCEWQIKVEFGNSIEIQFNVLDIEKDSLCDYDWIKIYNGPDNTYNLLTKVCHQIKPIVVSSTGNYMFIEFVSDYSYHGKGFSSNYSTVPTKCGGRFTAAEGSIFSPNYPKNYNKNDTCSWLIDIDETHSIELTFEDVDLFQSTNCSHNYVKIYDGPTAAYRLLETVCGNNKPNRTIQSTFNEMYIEFKSSMYFTTKGFLAKYRKACGSRITTQGSGTIRINHNEFTENINNCTWTIVSTDPSRHISLTISHMQQQTFYDEYEKNINVYSGESTESPLIGSYSSRKVPPTLVSDGSAMTIALESEMDFFATYSVFDSHCGGTITSGGYFATPGYPRKYASDTQCEWTIKVASGNHVTLSFSYFQLPESTNCNADYLEIRKYNASGKLLGVYCGTNKPSNVTHEGSMWLMFKSSKLDADDTAMTAKGFYGEFSLDNDNELSGPKGVIESPLYPESYLNYGSFSWKITVATGKRVLISFKEFYMESNPDNEDYCYFASISFYDGVDETASLLRFLCGQITPDPIKSSSNILFITVNYNSARMGTKFVLEWLEISNVFQATTIAPPAVAGCGSASVIEINTLHNYTITSPGYPDNYKPNLNCEWIFSTTPGNHLIIYFLDLNLKNYLVYSRSHLCNADYVNLYQKSSTDNDWKLLKNICTLEDHKGALIHATNLLKVNFVTNRYLHGTGFKASVLEVCGGSLTESTGYIIFNNSTLRDAVCQWNITVRSGKTIELTFEEMNIPFIENKGCNFYLMVRNGKYPDSPLLGNGKYCGTQLPEPLKSTGNYLYLKYSGLPNIVGFRLKYREVSVSCGGEIKLTQFDKSAEITSLNYPNIPPPHSECSWLFMGPPGESFRVDFEERFDLTNNQNCEIEYVELRDGGTEMSPLIGRFCDAAPSSQYSTDNVMLIKFFTNTEDPKNGFKANISLAYCGGTIRGNSGEIKSPTSRASAQNQNCTWHIIGPANHYLNLWFTNLKTKWLRNCFPSSLVTISESSSASENVTRLGEYCGTTLPSPIRSSSNEVIVNYLGDNNDNFILKFNASQSECGETINEESGTIQSSGYPIMSHRMRTCRWVIEVPEGRRITLKIEDLDLDETTYKLDQGLIVYDGLNYLLRLSYLRAGDPKQTIESSSNKMVVAFWSRSFSNRRGFKASFSSNKPTICIGDFSGESGVITQPMVRNSSYWCHWKHIGDDIHLNKTFALTMDLQMNVTKKTKTVCQTWTRTSIYITNEENTNIISKLCNPTSNHIVRTPFPITRVMARTVQQLQMNFTIQYNTHECGGIINKQRGYISSPKFPNKPSKTFECAWLLKVDKEQTINLTTFNDDLGDDCDKSFLSVYNGDRPTHPRIGKYCHNTKIERIIISQSNSLWLEYKWEKGSTGTGFNLSYEAIGGGCGGVYHDKSRRIQTPNYGKDYPNNAECLWEIRASAGYSIRLRFIERFYLEQSINCQNDYVEIWDWRDDAWVSLGKRCGRTTPSDMQSTGEKLKLLFRSNNETTASGFKAMWDWTCGGTFEATRTPHYIVSPGYPEAYSPLLNCVYNITTNTEVVIIRFDDFELENGSSDCKYDNVTITGKYFLPHAISRNSYCGTTTPPMQRMKGNVIITFKTDRWVNRRGFKFMYSDESCGGEIDQETVIESPSYNESSSVSEYRFYRPRIKCVWKITAPANKMVVLRVNELRMSLTPMCFAQNVVVYNGLLQKYSDLLSTLCGDIIEGQPISAESGKMLVKLDTSPHNYGGFKAEVYFSHGPAEGCGGTINLTESKTIQAPNLEDLDCSWKIIAPRDYQIDIQFEEINVPGSCSKNNTFLYCTCSFIEVRDGGGPISDLIEKLCSTSNAFSRTFTTSWNTAYIRFFLRGRQNNAFKATLTPVLSKCGPSVLNVTKDIQVLTSPNYPNKYPSYIKCNWVFNSALYEKIALHFVEFDLSGEGNYHLTNNICSGDKIEIIEDPNRLIISEGLGPNSFYVGARRSLPLNYNDVHARHTFCGKEESPFDYYSTGKSVTLSFKTHYSQSNVKGFKLEYSLVGCSRNYTSVQGRVASSDKEKSECVITITVPENRTISLYFQQFYIPFSPNCSDMAFEVRDNDLAGVELFRSCGYRMPNPIFSYTNRLYIHIAHKRSNVFMSRFDFSYTSTEAGRGCGGMIYNYRGRFSSPLYPNEFRNESKCTWNVRVPTGLHVVLKFINFDIQGDCDQTNVAVTTYSDDVSTTRKFCQDDRPAIMRSSNSRIDVIYSSSIHNGGTGWMALYQGVTEDTKDVN